MKYVVVCIVIFVLIGLNMQREIQLGQGGRKMDRVEKALEVYIFENACQQMMLEAQAALAGSGVILSPVARVYPAKSEEMRLQWAWEYNPSKGGQLERVRRHLESKLQLEEEGIVRDIKEQGFSAEKIVVSVKRTPQFTLTVIFEMK